MLFLHKATKKKIIIIPELNIYIEERRKKNGIYIIIFLLIIISLHDYTFLDEKMTRKKRKST